MPLDFKFPDVGEGTTEGTLVKWLLAEGDKVKADQPIAEIETDKAVVEIPSPKTGVILKLYGKPGEVIKVGNVLATIGDAGESAGASKPTPTQTTTVSPSKSPASLAQGSTSSSTNAILATPSTRQLARSLNVDLSRVKGTGPGGRITDEDVKNASAVSTITKSKSPSSSIPPSAPSSSYREPWESAPSASASSLPHVHPDDTVETTQGTHVVSPLAHVESTKQAWKSEGSEERIPLRGLRKTISDRMVKSMFTAVQVTHMDEVDVTALVELREKEKLKMEKKGIKLTFLPFIAKACVAALHNHPYLNASIDDSTQEVVLKKYFHVGMAVDTEDGLIVPVIRNVDQKSIVQLAQEMQDIAQKTRERRISPEDLKGSTFTITNIGSLGGVYATPVINWPEVAILGVGKIQEKPVVRAGKIVIRHMMTVSLTFDHRIIDGAQAVRFTNEILQHLEDPGLFLLDVI
ncbi:MAG: 2-oxo acid dehydrogenase subunit E2 [Candidatus Diapherotrites archaeon]|uniref:2-oxo acid dehydrogenase subunit E2 n=1 Tax=Candidatus Iainarchaeum sp. TaxID=3101447 RepID=A0A8T4C7S0_9ARCH|nr:2-oxo acid dehydrogenase subunit E2 [Candidatus Diapherotrites archaeon]